MNNEKKRKNCVRCKHYFVTWEKKRPHGCRGYEFKSAQIPSQVVLRTSGLACMKFEEKVR